MTKEKKTVATWCYPEDGGKGTIKQLEAGAKMPDGFVDTPAKQNAPAKKKTPAK